MSTIRRLFRRRRRTDAPPILLRLPRRGPLPAAAPQPPAPTPGPDELAVRRRLLAALREVIR